MRTVTYGRLDEVLRSLGFAVQLTDDDGPPARVYIHAGAKAAIPLPAFPLEDPALQRHLVAVRGTLEWTGILEPADFEDLLRKAG